jgi:AcrR family transcriptional regulator
VAVDRKKEILDAAVQCFGRYGYEKTTVDDIGGLVGINKASLYYHFKNKETIFTEALFRESSAFTETLKREIETVRGCRAQVLAMVRSGLERGEGAELIKKASLEALKGLTPLLRKFRHEALVKGAQFLASILEQGQDSHELRKFDAPRVARTIQTVIYSMNDSAFMQSKPAPVDEILGAVGMMLDGLAQVKGDQQ